MVIIRIIGGMAMLLLLLIICPVMIGALILLPSKKEETDNFIFSYMIGLLSMLALSEVLSVPLTLLKQSFMHFVIAYSCGLLIMVLASLTFARKKCIRIVKGIWDQLKNFQVKWIPVLLGIFVPIIILAFYTPYIYGDDKVYLSMVNDMVVSDRLYLTNINTGDSDGWVIAKYALSSYWTWIAYIVKISGIHTLILCKTILAFVYVPISYAIQELFARYLFHGDTRKVYVYMLILILVTLFGGFSNYPVTYRLYVWVWQSKALLAIMVLPFLFYYCNVIFEKVPCFWEYFILFIMILGTCSTTLTGTGLAVGMVCILAAYYMVVHRKIGIFVKSFLMCIPAYFLMFFYLLYDEILAWTNFYG